MSKPRGSYSRRRTEISRDEMRETLKLNQIDSHEKKVFFETLRACERFHDSRGTGSASLTNDFRRVSIQIVNLREKPSDGPKWKKKPIQISETKSLKAALLREIAMAARRSGLIKDGYHNNDLQQVNWDDQLAE